MTTMTDATAQTISTHPPDPADLVGLLHARGQRATPQRLVILRELRRRRRHATAEEIGHSIRDELPGTSMPTVYATLDLLVELGLLRRIDTGAAALYDAGTEPHQHTVCRRCGRVDDLDFEVDAEALGRASDNAGFTAQSIEIIVAGICPDCAG
jgi:Fe2+ or Zn2+ uptake regulation protein